jgi:urease accessory protein
MVPLDLVIWQLSDSAFPAGGFTHSSGLEASVQHGHVRTIADVERTTAQVIRQAGRGSLPLVRAAHQVPDRLPWLDALADAFLNHPISNRASRAQGLALVGSAVQIFAGTGHTGGLRILADRVQARRLFGHHAPIFGAVFAALSVDVETASRLFLFQSARSVASAAVRLGVAGAFDAQRVLAGTGRDIAETLEACRGLAPDDIAQTAPLLDLAQSTQDRLYSRLFQS